MKKHSSLPEGKRVLPGVLCGIAGGLIAAALWVLEYTGEVDNLLRDWYLHLELNLLIEEVLPQIWLVAVSVVLAFVVSWIVLDCEGIFRQCFVLIFIGLLLAGASLSAALWGWVVNPLLPFVASCSSGILAMLYAIQHKMPCDIVLAEVQDTERRSSEVFTAVPASEGVNEFRSTTEAKVLDKEEQNLKEDSKDNLEGEFLSQSVEKIMMPFPSIRSKVENKDGKD